MVADGVKRREIGRARSARNQLLTEDNADLRFPQSARVFAKMLREDTQVKSVIRAVTLPIRRAGWRLDPNGAPDEVVALASEDLRLQVVGESPSKPVAPRQGRVSFEKHLEDALKCLVFGYMFFEQVYAPGVDGREHLVKLAPRWPGTVEKINVADDGGLESIEQRGYSTGRFRLERTKIPVEHLVAYVYDDQCSEWTGQSVLRPAYKNWVLKDELLRKELTTLERNGMGVPIYRGSDLAIDPDADLEYGQEVAERLRSGEYAGAAIPAGAQLELKGVSGQLVSPREAIAYHDSQIAKAVLAHFLNLEGKGGSYALAQTQSDLFVQSLQTIAEWLADVFTQHVIEDLVRVAFPEHDGLCPRLVFDPIASKKELTAQDLATLVRDGVILPDKDLEEHTRRVFSMPPKQKLADALAGKKYRQDLEQTMGVTLSEPAEPPPPESDASTAAAEILRSWSAKRTKEGVVSD